MPLSQKELEVFLWEQAATCEMRGLRINQMFYALGRRYQHLDLGPYGIAQQVNVRFLPSANCYFVQAILSTAGPVGAHLYLRAKQVLSAMNQALQRATEGMDLSPARLSCVLIGRRVEIAGNFVFALNLDADCQAFTYRYDAAGLRFKPVVKNWIVTGSDQAPALAELGLDLLSEGVDARDIAEAALAGIGAADMAPTDLADLVVTPTGVLANPNTLR